MIAIKIEPLTLEEILKIQLTLHKEFGVQDFYKFLFQAALGCEHAVSDPQFTFGHLQKEVLELQPDYKEPLIEQLAPDGSLIRVNLRPYSAKGGSLEILNKKFFLTSSEFKGSLTSLELYWQKFRQFATKHIGSIISEDLDDFWEEMKLKDFPALHHSSTYKECNKPAYRVVLSKLITEELNRIG